jgi:hypothetical protein
VAPEIRCPLHKAEHEAGRRADSSVTGRRGTSPEWRRARGLALWLATKTCQDCGLTEDEVKRLGGHLEVDHLDGDPLNNGQGNLRVRCDSCHRRHHREEEAEVRRQASVAERGVPGRTRSR